MEFTSMDLGKQVVEQSRLLKENSEKFMRQIDSDKLRIILELKSNPIVLSACKKIGLSTSTFYRWQNEDGRFNKEVKRAIARGREQLCDIAENNVVKAVRQGDMRASTFWLKHFRTPYKKEDGSASEINYPNRDTTRHKGRTDVLTPTNHDRGNEKLMGASKMKSLINKLNKAMHLLLGERALIQDLGKQGYSDKEIDRIIRKRNKMDIE
ncbi:MAG: seg [Parcubacteria group bacterium]|nr:seg [Parcubacteria group bacterium]